jgi:hypothetical protein
MPVNGSLEACSVFVTVLAEVGFVTTSSGVEAPFLVD